jgi:hypothetical protein
VGTDMYRYQNHWFGRAWLHASTAGLLLMLVAGCGGSDGVGPSTEAPSATAPGPVDPTGTPADSASAPAPTDPNLSPPSDSSGISGAVASLDTRSPLPGIVFASGDMDNQFFNSVHTGSKRGGGITPTNILSLLADARAKGARLFLKLCMGKDSYVKNPDGTFSVTKWKALVDRFRSVNLDPYIADGTLLGHFLIDEPHRASKWGGQIIPHATVEALAQYSKQIWPSLNTFVHTKTDWLASTPITYTHLDAGWTQYAAGKGTVTTWIASEIARAKSKGLGLVVGLNVLHGGNGSSGNRLSGGYSMSASELRSYGTTLLNQSYACAFFMWQHNTTYYGRSDVKIAMAELSTKAKAHVKTSCRQ